MRQLSPYLSKMKAIVLLPISLFIYLNNKYNTKEHSPPPWIPEAQLAINNWNIAFPLTLSIIAIRSFSGDQSLGATLAKSNFGDKKPRLVQTQSNFGLSLTQWTHRNSENLRPWCTSWLPNKDSGVHQPTCHVPSLSQHIVRESVWVHSFSREGQMTTLTLTLDTAMRSRGPDSIDRLMHFNNLLTTLMHLPAGNHPNSCYVVGSQMLITPCKPAVTKDNQKSLGGVICVKTL